MIKRGTKDHLQRSIYRFRSFHIVLRGRRILLPGPTSSKADTNQLTATWEVHLDPMSTASATLTELSNQMAPSITILDLKRKELKQNPNCNNKRRRVSTQLIAKTKFNLLKRILKIN
jgi:hypothetical protein